MPDAHDSQFGQTWYQPGGAPGPAGADQRRLAVLVVLRGAEVGRRYLLNESALVLGRRPDRAHIAIPGDQKISSVHCRLEAGPGPDAWTVVDLASTNGTFVWGQKVTSLPLRDGDRLQLGDTVLKFCHHDELEEAFHQQVDHLMNIDDLTGLPVQRVFQQRFQELLRAAARAGTPLGVLMMDLDGLKRINDSHGHLLGAHTIATVGRRLGAIVAEHGGTVSRFGGDEFSACAPLAAADDALQLGERLRAAVADAPVTLEGVTVQPTISIGAAVHPQDGATAECLVRVADSALYRAKAAGRNRVCR